MSTRKLILTALLCGMVILVAGAVQLLRLSGGDEDGDGAALLDLGQATIVGGLTASVESADADGVLVTVVVEIAGPGEVAALADGWAMITPTGDLVPRRTLSATTEPVPCAELTTAEAAVACSLGFELDDAVPTLDGYVVLFGRGSERASWSISL